MRITGNTLPEPAPEPAPVGHQLSALPAISATSARKSGRSPNCVAKEFAGQMHPDVARQVFWRTRTQHRCGSALLPRRPMSLAIALCYALILRIELANPLGVLAVAWIRLPCRVSAFAAISSTISYFRAMDALVDQPRAAIRQVFCAGLLRPMVDQDLAQWNCESMT